MGSNDGKRLGVCASHPEPWDNEIRWSLSSHPWFFQGSRGLRRTIRVPLQTREDRFEVLYIAEQWPCDTRALQQSERAEARTLHPNTHRKQMRIEWNYSILGSDHSGIYIWKNRLQKS